MMRDRQLDALQFAVNGLLQTIELSKRRVSCRLNCIVMNHEIMRWMNVVRAAFAGLMTAPGLPALLAHPRS